MKTQLPQTSFCKFQTPSLWVNSSKLVRHFGRMRHSKPDMLNSRLGLSLLYTETKLLSQVRVVTDRGRRFLMSQNTARPRFTSCFIRRMRASLGQHFLLLYPTMFSLFGSGCSVKYRWIRSRASSAVNLQKNIKWNFSPKCVLKPAATRPAATRPGDNGKAKPVFHHKNHISTLPTLFRQSTDIVWHGNIISTVPLFLSTEYNFCVCVNGQCVVICLCRMLLFSYLNLKYVGFFFFFHTACLKISFLSLLPCINKVNWLITWRRCVFYQCIWSKVWLDEKLQFPHFGKWGSHLASGVVLPSHWLSVSQAPVGPWPGHSTVQ